MQTVIVSDIFGLTDALQLFASELNNALIIDPYNSEIQNFESEQHAYQVFMANVGIDEYVDSLKTKVQGITEPILLIGFSIGASATWRLLAENNELNIKSAIGYYGSQIRNFTELHPNTPIELVFPKTESHFSVNELMAKLAGQLNTTLRQADFLHGFMNRYSANFSEQGYQQELSWLHSKLA